ncbi:MAG: N-acetylmuramoyl-L-alanine amidase [Paracoccaceae bacterium]
MDIIQHPSPNFGERRDGATPDLIVLHYTAMPETANALDRLCDPDCEVSSHYLIHPKGQIFQLVSEGQRAWHAGAGSWGECTDINSRSVGIELANDGCSPFSALQMTSLEALLSDIMTRRKIAPERVIGHSDMAFTRKSDPGSRFDWCRLALGGLSIWPLKEAAQVIDRPHFTRSMQTFGFPQSEDLGALVHAFRLRFRPWATGPLDCTDMAMINNLARRFPVDQRPLNT